MLQRSPKPQKTRRRARIEALDTLPVFFKLEGVPVLLIGGTAAAAWKAELLEASGAHVLWVAEAFEEKAKAILASPRIKGKLQPRLQDWKDLDLRAFRFAVADLPPADCEAFVQQANAANLLHNVIDQTEHCQFQFGSIVNRSPLVIGINTNGAVPVLGQVMRQKIEALIPAHLQTWLNGAAKCRHKVLEALPEVGSRRAFWRKFINNGFESKGTPCQNMEVLKSPPLQQTMQTSEFWIDPKGPYETPKALINALGMAEKIECTGNFPEVLTPYLRRETEVISRSFLQGDLTKLTLFSGG